MEQTGQNRRRANAQGPLPMVLISALAVLLVGVLIFILFYNHIYVGTLRNDTAAVQRRELATSVQDLDAVMSGSVKALGDAANIPSVRTFMGHSGDYAMYHEIIDELMLYKSRVGRAFSLWTVYTKENVVLTSNEGYSDVDHFYDHIWENFDSSAQLRGEEARISRVHTISSPAFGAMRVVSLLQKIEMYGEGAQEECAYVVMNFRLEDVISLLGLRRWESPSGEQELMIYDHKGQYIYDRTGLQGLIPEEIFTRIRTGNESYVQTRLGDQLYLGMSLESTLLPWTLLRFSTYLNQSGGTDLLLKVVLIAMALGFLISLALVVEVYRRVFVPYRRVLGRVKSGDLSGETSYRDDMDYLEGMMTRAMQAQAQVKERVLEHALFFPVEHEDEAAPLGDFLLVMLCASQTEQSYLLQAERSEGALQEAIAGCFAGERGVLGYERLYVLPLYASAAVILEGDQVSVERTRSVAGRIREAMGAGAEDTGVRMDAFMISDVNQGQRRLHQAYLQAREALRIYYNHPEERIAAYTDLAGYEMKTYKPNPVVMDMFRNHLSAHRFDQVQEALVSIRADVEKCSAGCILTNLRITQDGMFDRLYQAARLLDQDPPAFYADVLRGSVFFGDANMAFATAREGFDAMEQMVEHLRSFCQTRPAPAKAQSRSQIVEQAVEYIDENYTRGISLYEIAMGLGVDETYLSRIFKEKMDCSFVQYVTRCRLGKAKELLADPGKTLAEVAEQVGMGNAQNFIRTFKKYEGVTPGVWRKEQQRERMGASAPEHLPKK